MNLKTDLSNENQKLLYELGIKSENREYSKDEIKNLSSSIGDYIFSQSSKNNDIEKAIDEYGDLLRVFVKNEK